MPIATRPSCIFGIHECHKSCGYRGIVLYGTCTILCDEGSLKIEFCSEVVNLRGGISTEEGSESDQRLGSVKRTTWKRMQGFPDRFSVDIRDAWWT